MLHGLAPRRVGLGVHLDHTDKLTLLLKNRWRIFKHIVTVEYCGRNLLAVIFSKGVPLPVVRNPRPFHLVGHGRRPLARLEGHRIKRIIVPAIDQLAVPIHIHQVEPELVGARAAHADQPPLAGRDHEELLRERPRRLVSAQLAGCMILDMRRRISRPIPHLRPGLVARDTVKSVRIVKSLHRINHADRPVIPLMMSHTCEHDLRAAWNRTRFCQHVRPYALATPEGLHIAPILIHGPETLHAPQRLVRIFPARENNPSIVQHRRQIFRFAIRREHINIFAIRITPRNRKGVRGRKAAHITMLTRRDKNNLTIRGKERIMIIIIAKGQLFQLRAIRIAGIEVIREIIRRAVTKHDTLAIPRQIRTRKAPLQLRKQILQGLLASLACIQPSEGHGDKTAAEITDEAVALQGLMRPMHAIALLALGIRIVNQEDAIEIHGWIFEHHLAFDRANIQVHFFRVSFHERCFQKGIERLLLRSKIRLRHARYHLLRIPYLICDGHECRLIITLEQPFPLQHIFRPDACRKSNPQSYNPFSRHNSPLLLFYISITDIT